MLRAFCARCTHFGFLLWILNICFVGGYIEIVEEQQCHDFKFRLTCRDLDSHIAVLEAWYTSADDYQDSGNETVANLQIKTENDSELNRVYAFSSPKHNGVYEPVNITFESSLLNVKNSNFNVLSSFTNVNSSFVNVNSSLINVNNSFDFGLLFNDTVDLSVGFVNDSACGGVTFSRSYGSLREGDKRRKSPERHSSINLRAPVSYRCTGVNHCSFLLAEDYPPAVSWLSGMVYIKYACFDDTLAVHYCNREVQIAPAGEDSEGYIRTPGYPNFYVGDDVCRWKLQANPEQRIRVTLLDVSLRSIAPFEPSCLDHVLVQDSNGDELLSSCEQVDLPLRLTSSTSSVEVVVEAKSHGAYPKRGVLLHYKSIGCVTLPAPSSGYIVYRNDDVAHYMCNVNYVFADTLQRARLLWCYDDNRWNDTLPECIEAAVTVVGDDSASVTSDKAEKLPPHEQPDMIVDIVIPSLLIAALFIGNAFIVLIIYKYRKRKNDDIDDEFNTIPLSVNGNVHCAGNAV